MCADVMNVFLLHYWSIYVYLQIFKVYANAENSTILSHNINNTNNTNTPVLLHNITKPFY